jgi:hypothetical protein
LGPNSDVPSAARYSSAVKTLPALTPPGVVNEKLKRFAVSVPMFELPPEFV